jgi:hypothetical protein
MTDRLDQKYLKPQIKVFEKVIKEWTVIFVLFVFPWFVYTHWDEYPLYAMILGSFSPYAVYGLFYVAPRGAFLQYFAFRKVVMDDDGK